MEVPMRILVTGGAGFIGSNFVNYFNRRHPESKIYVVDIMDYCASKHNLQMDPKIKFIKGDIADRHMILFLLQEYQISHLIHFAAQSYVDGSFNQPDLFIQTNIVGTQHLLEACVEYGKLLKIIHVSTDEVYGESLSETFDERSILCPTNPYAASKAAAEMIVNSYYKSYNLPIIITRGNNVYGPGQYPEKLIPKFIYRLTNGSKCTVHGNGSAIRSYIYVEDVVKAFELILLSGKIGEIYNIGNEDEYSVIDVLKELVGLIHQTKDIAPHYVNVTDRVFNDRRYLIHYEKLKQLGWNPTTSFQEGLTRTISWYTKIDYMTYWEQTPKDL